MSDAQDRELLRFADEIARYQRPSAPGALRAQLRAALMAAPVVAPRRRPWFSLAALRPVLALALVVALLAAGGGIAAASSLPGDPAFALKRAVEDAQVTLALDDATRLDTLVTQSDRRLADLETVAAVRPNALTAATNEYLGAVGRVDTALAIVVGQLATPARDSAIARASASSANHLATLQSLAARLPAQAQPGIQRAIEAQQAVHGRSGDKPGQPGTPGSSAPPGRPSDLPRPSDVPGGPPPGRSGPPTAVPGRR